MQTSRTYIYDSLPADTIRLLVLHPAASESSLIKCSLQVAYFAQNPRYEALSYCWGDATQKLPIECDGYPMQVTPSLHSALVRLRLANQPRTIWADAVCINQNDVDEQTAQVRKMQAIYRQAFSVVIWLGPGVEVDGKDLWPIPNLLEAASKNLKRTQLPIRHGTKDWLKFVLSNDWTTNGDLEDKRWNALIKSLILLLQRPWFTRTWIIQEVALAHTAVVLCGSHSATWDDFYRAVSYAIDLDYFTITAPEVYGSVRHIEKARRDIAAGIRQRPLDFLTSFRMFLATDLRDKVFALYGLFDPADAMKLELQPDYHLHVLTVYIQAAIDCITTEQNLDILSFTSKSKDNEHHLPSWAPDWAYYNRTKPILPRFLFNDYNAQQNPNSCSWKSATGTSIPNFHLSPDKKQLFLSGHHLDTIVSTGGVLEKDYYVSQPGDPLVEINEFIKKSTEIFEKWEDMCGVPHQLTYPFTGEAAWDVYWKTLHAGCYPYTGTSSTADNKSKSKSKTKTDTNIENTSENLTKASFQTWYRPFQEMRQMADYMSNRIEEIRDSPRSFPYKVAASIGWFTKSTWKSAKFGLNLMYNRTQQARIVAIHRTVVRTEKGYVGIAGREVREGDTLVLVEGGKVPVVLRGVEEEGDGERWTVVSDAYVHGVMNGEAFDPRNCMTFCIV